MRKLFTTLLLSVITLTASAINWTYQTNPAEGNVESLKTVLVYFDEFFDISMDNDSYVTVTHNGNTLAAALDIVYAGPITYVSVELEEEATEAGAYTITIQQGAFTGHDRSYQNSYPLDKNIVLEYSISGNSGGGDTGGDDTNYTVTPAQGNVTEISEIKIAFSGYYDVAYDGDIAMPTITKNGEPYSADFYEDVDYIDSYLLEFDTPITEAGTYVVTIPANKIKLATYSNMSDYTAYSSPIVLTYTIGGGSASEPDFTYTVTPENNSTLEELSEVSMVFPNLTNVMPGYVTVTHNNEPMSTPAVEASCEGNVIKFSFTPALTSGNVEINIPAEGLFSEINGSEISNTEAIVLNYTLQSLPETEYTLEFCFSNPKPNAEGQISAEKSFTGMQFFCEGAGMSPADDLAEDVKVVMKEVNGDFETTATLSKTYGYQTTRSYFVAGFTNEPRYNGEYTITFPQGMIGDEAWLANHSTGISNKETVLRFTLIDGEDHTNGIEEVINDTTTANGVYNLMGVRVADRPENLPAGIYVYGGKKIVITK